MRTVLSIAMLAAAVLAAILTTLGVAGPRSSRDLAPEPTGGRPGAVIDPIGDDEGGDDEGADEPAPFVTRFTSDPLGDPGLVLAGEPLARLTWHADAPAFPGDAPGSLEARYDAGMPAGLFGFALPAALDESDVFTAAAAFVVSSGGFVADPNGFFEISWGLWSSSTTGLNRTGDFTTSAGDTFDLVEFDWFPNVSSFFGGPFLTPTVFGAAATAHPDFVALGAFANFASLFNLEAGLPLDVPLLAVLEHRPDLDALVVQVYRLAGAGELLPVDGAVGVLPLGALPLRSYTVDTVGLTLWRDGFGGSAPAVVADLTFHALVVMPGLVGRPEELLDVASE